MKSELRKRLVKEAFEKVKDLDLSEEDWMYKYLDCLIDIILRECIDIKPEAIKRKFGIKNDTN